MAISTQQADQLLAIGQISPEAYAQVYASHGMSPPMAPAPSMSTPAPAPFLPLAPQPPVSQAPPMMSSAPPVMSPAPMTSSTPPVSNMSVAPEEPLMSVAPPPVSVPPANPRPREPVMTVVDRPLRTPPAPSAPPVAASPRPVDARQAAVDGQVERLEGDRVSVEAHLENALAKANDAEKVDLANRVDFEKLSREQAAERAREDNDIRDQVVKLNADVEAYSKEKVDPNRMFSSMNVGQQFAAVLSVMMGGLAQGLSKGALPNNAMKMLESSIDNDIRAQEATLLAKGRSLDSRRGALRDMMAITDSRDVGRLAAKNAMLEGAKMKVQEVASRYGTMEAQLNGQDLLKQIGDKQAEIREQLAVTKENELRAARAAAAQAAAAREKEMWNRGKELGHLDNERRKLDQEDRKLDIEQQKVVQGGAPAKARALAGLLDTRNKNFEENWGKVVDSTPGWWVTGMKDKYGRTDQKSINDAGRAALLPLIKKKGDSDQVAEARLMTVMPRENDDENTIAVKKKMMRGMMEEAARELALEHGIDLQGPPPVPTTAAPGN